MLQTLQPIRSSCSTIPLLNLVHHTSRLIDSWPTTPTDGACHSASRSFISCFGAVWVGPELNPVITMRSLLGNSSVDLVTVNQ